MSETASAAEPPITRPVAGSFWTRLRANVARRLGKKMGEAQAPNIYPLF